LLFGICDDYFSTYSNALRHLVTCSGSVAAMKRVRNVLKRIFMRKAKVLNGPVEARQMDHFDRTAERHVRMLFGGKL